MRKALSEFGFIQVVNDQAVFVLKTNNKVHGLVHVWVDDLIYCGDNQFDLVMQTLWERLKWGEEGNSDVKHLGMEIKQHKDHVTVCQSSYILGLERVKLDSRPIRKDRDRNVSWRELNEREKKNLQVLVRCFMWIAMRQSPLCRQLLILQLSTLLMQTSC